MTQQAQSQDRQALAAVLHAVPCHYDFPNPQAAKKRLTSPDLAHQAVEILRYHPHYGFPTLEAAAEFLAGLYQPDNLWTRQRQDERGQPFASYDGRFSDDSRLAFSFYAPEATYPAQKWGRDRLLALTAWSPAPARAEDAQAGCRLPQPDALTPEQKLQLHNEQLDRQPEPQRAPQETRAYLTALHAILQADQAGS